MKQHSRSQAGFGAVEGLVIFVIVALIGTAGFYVMKNKTTTENTDTTISAKKTTVDASKVGTTAGIDQLTSLDDQSEGATDAKYQISEQQAASSDNASLKAVGGAYDENSF